MCRCRLLYWSIDVRVIRLPTPEDSAGASKHLGNKNLGYNSFDVTHFVSKPLPRACFLFDLANPVFVQETNPVSSCSRLPRSTRKATAYLIYGQRVRCFHARVRSLCQRLLHCLAVRNKLGVASFFCLLSVHSTPALFLR